jgi:hypothetical protein
MPGRFKQPRAGASACPEGEQETALAMSFAVGDLD